MSEYQYYEFVAVDRPLDTQAQAEVRSLSTRARITATSFINEYHWGSFRGEPSRMMEHYYDAHLYLANWGTRQVMLRLPCNVLDIAVAEQYCVGDQVTTWTAGEFVVLALTSEDEPGDWDYEPEGSLSAIVGVRAELAAGDLRPLYLAWLAGYGTWERDEYAFDRTEDEELEPPLPPGLRSLTAAQRELADFLRLDPGLLDVAAEASPPLDEAADDPTQLATWVASLPASEKNELLLRVIRDQAAAARRDMVRRFRGTTATKDTEQPRRTVADLLDAAARRRADRQQREAVRRSEEEARREAARALAQQRRLDELARDEPGAWSRIDAMIATRKSAEYDAAVALLTDLRALAERETQLDEFTRRSRALRQRHARKISLLDRLTRAGI
ncbi:hypothetical protein [Amycolatopsis alkalitolerans]|uniref:Uncharacterized protein n=1 Tax=Amycolatopsis alkalitolerans TaxID=2547244 RepID=A0A5C4LUQ9_9PSEU|nr:hypothetical protein [Amycolatopsis alkalitolerans]TNC21448.1 hypothetical protein FG385_28435 [Amycolatopsis alkalitolerans]